MVDSKPPKVTITVSQTECSDSARFTAADTQDYEFLGDGLASDMQNLKPLKFRLMKQRDKGMGVIGTDTLVVTTKTTR